MKLKKNLYIIQTSLNISSFILWNDGFLN